MMKISIFIFLFIISKSKNSNITLKVSLLPIINKMQTKSKEKNSEFQYINPSNKEQNFSFRKIDEIKKNLIIGAITGYNWEILYPFFKSYELAGFENCECVMFVGNMESNTIDKIKSSGVIVYNISDKYIYQKIINIRWKIYEDYLNENKDKYNLVFTTDLRDSFFQKDIFKYYDSKKPFLGLALEDGTLSEEVNQGWIRRTYNDEIYESMKNERIICVGTVWGTPDKFFEFSKIMWERLSSEWSLRVNAIEQAVGNYLIYHDKMFNDCIVKSDNKDGPVMTIALTNRNDINFDLNNNILNKKGEIAAVIHQYDRKKDILEFVTKKYSIDKNNTIYNKNSTHILDFFTKRWYYQNKIIVVSFLIISIIIGIIWFFANKNSIKHKKTIEILKKINNNYFMKLNKKVFCKRKSCSNSNFKMKYNKIIII